MNQNKDINLRKILLQFMAFITMVNVFVIVIFMTIFYFTFIHKEKTIIHNDIEYVKLNDNDSLLILLKTVQNDLDKMKKGNSEITTNANKVKNITTEISKIQKRLDDVIITANFNNLLINGYHTEKKETN